MVSRYIFVHVRLYWVSTLTKAASAVRCGLSAHRQQQKVTYNVNLLLPQACLIVLDVLQHPQSHIQSSLQGRVALQGVLNADIDRQRQHVDLELQLVPESEHLRGMRSVVKCLQVSQDVAL